MRILIYLGIALIAGFIGYKIAEVIILNKEIKGSISPIVNEIKIQLTIIENKLKEQNSPDEMINLEAQRKKLVSLLKNF